MDESSTVEAASPDPLDLPDLSQLREKPRWGGAIAATVILDVIGLGALFAAYSYFHVVELAYGMAPDYGVLFVQVLLFAPVAQLQAAAVARRKGTPWLVPVWALPFTVGAVFAAVWGATSMAGIASFVR